MNLFHSIPTNSSAKKPCTYVQQKDSVVENNDNFFFFFSAAYVMLFGATHIPHE